MNYIEAYSYIKHTAMFGSKLGLENIGYLLSLMGEPQRGLRLVHIAGTNGKGSTAAYISGILIEAGYKTGLFTSPYITDITEMLQIDRHNISEGDFANIITTVDDAAKKMVGEGYSHPTQYELLTAAALLYFKNSNTDIAVLETGLGGRLDATNIIDTPLISVITSISLDHTEYLGDTVAKIAAEKCGIIKHAGITAVYAEQAEEAMTVIREAARAKNNRLFMPDLNQIKLIESTLSGIVLEHVKYGRLHISLLGEHQVKNAALALCVIELLRDEYRFNISSENIKNGFKNAVWSGRLEIIKQNPLIIIDGAHNISGVLALKKALAELVGDKRLTLVMGMLKDKDYKKALTELAPITDKFIAITPDNPRALPARELYNEANGLIAEAFFSNDIKNGVKLALEITDTQDIICFCGSLYMIADIKAALKEVEKNAKGTDYKA